MNVLLVGATGAVGGELVKAAPKFNIDRLYVLVRRDLDTSEFDNQEWYKTHMVVKKVSFEDVGAAVGEVAAELEGAQGKLTHCISSLGTTRAKAKTAEGFKSVDYHLNYDIAKAAAKAGAEHYSIVSTVGANAKSNFLYTQTKGQLDEDVQKLGFSTVSIFRPSLILTDRRNESRPLEAVMQACSKLADLGGWWSIHASKIAHAIWIVAQNTAQKQSPDLPTDPTAAEGTVTNTQVYEPKQMKDALREWEKQQTATEQTATEKAVDKTTDDPASEKQTTETVTETAAVEPPKADDVPEQQAPEQQATEQQATEQQASEQQA